jgi:Family of unknown function (DUF6134)
MTGSPGGSRSGWLIGALLAVLSPAMGYAGPEVETRDFNVFVDGKPAGEVHMTINKQADGSVVMNCDTDIKIRILMIKTYVYSYRGREQWKDGRLQRFDSVCDDDGKRHVITAIADGDKLKVRVNTEERTARADVWLTSYWSMPDANKVNQTIPIMDADTGVDLEARVVLVGVEDRNVAGQMQKVTHYRLVGKAPAELWFDVSGRLVAQDLLLEDGHRTQVELSRLRR